VIVNEFRTADLTATTAKASSLLGQYQVGSSCGALILSDCYRTQDLVSGPGHDPVVEHPPVGLARIQRAFSPGGLAVRIPLPPAAGPGPRTDDLARMLASGLAVSYARRRGDPIDAAALQRVNPSRALASTHRRDFTVINDLRPPAWEIIGFPLVFGAEFLELCPHRRDLVANLGRREDGSVYKPTPTIDFILAPTIDFILGADDHLIGIAIHGDEALGLLDLLHQIRDSHGLVSIGGIPRFMP
jgi:hypothetical protein